MRALIFLVLRLLVAAWTALAAWTLLEAWRHGSGLRAGERFQLAFHGGIDDVVQTELSGGRFVAVTGGIRVDLREATLPEAAERVPLTVRALAGGVEVIVPPTWRVELQAKAVMGGVANHVEPSDDASAPLLMVDALAVMGGIYVSAEPLGAEPTGEA
ncbi:MAG: hypothetical protein ACPGQL_04345 [Thermoplasmatota archaeon]